MVQGSCACGEIRVEVQNQEAQAKALCHCADCKKLSGSAYSTNIIVPGNGLKLVSGKPKTWTKKADSGNDITSFLCGTCGSTLWREGATFGDAKVVKVGTLDGNALEDAKPAIELYANDRPSWVSAVGGAGQKKGMPDSADA